MRWLLGVAASVVLAIAALVAFGANVVQLVEFFEERTGICLKAQCGEEPTGGPPRGAPSRASAPEMPLTISYMRTFGTRQTHDLLSALEGRYSGSTGLDCPNEEDPNPDPKTCTKVVSIGPAPGKARPGASGKEGPFPEWFPSWEYNRAQVLTNPLVVPPSSSLEDSVMGMPGRFRRYLSLAIDNYDRGTFRTCREYLDGYFLNEDMPEGDYRTRAPDWVASGPIPPDCSQTLLKRVGFLFLVIENNSGRDLTDVTFSYSVRHVSNCFNDNSKVWEERFSVVETEAMSWGRSGCARVVEQSRTLAAIRNGEKMIWLVHVYKTDGLTDPDRKSGQILSDVYWPRSFLLGKRGQETEHLIRSPLREKALTYEIPLGALGQ